MRRRWFFGRCYLLLVIDKNSLNNTGVRHLGRQDGMIGASTIKFWSLSDKSPCFSYYKCSSSSSLFPDVRWEYFNVLLSKGIFIVAR